LWSSSTDGSIRIWDISQPAEKSCQYCITKDSNALGNNPQGAPSLPGQGAGHTQAVTSLLSFNMPGAGLFILSSSLDGTIKAWNSTTGACVHTETHGEGVVCMALADPNPNNSMTINGVLGPDGLPIPADTNHLQVLLIGLESGKIMCRNLVQTANSSAFQLLFTLSAKFTAGHDGAVRCIAPGPAATFYSGGEDGKLMVWQFTGDLGIQ
jgi:WD40 repeat protein